MTRRTVNRLSAALLAIGLTAGLAIFIIAQPDELDPLLGDPFANKKYLRELRVLGGRANVAAAEFQEWFAGLWRGKTLGGTIAVLTLAGTFGFRFFALLPPLPPDAGPSSRVRPE